jgi:predicted NAD/FAD-dependent oxidoreductase
MLGFKNKLNTGWDAALVKNSNISWISNNSSKPNRKLLNSIVVIASNKWSDKNIDTNNKDVITEMLKTLFPIIKYK